MSNIIKTMYLFVLNFVFLACGEKQASEVCENNNLNSLQKKMTAVCKSDNVVVCEKAQIKIAGCIQTLVGLNDKFTPDPEDSNIKNILAETIEESVNKCKIELPKISGRNLKAGIQPDCFDDFSNRKIFHCVCRLTLYKPGSNPFEEYAFYLRN